MAKENRSDVKEYYNLSNRLKNYGNNITVLDIDGEENTYTISNRGRYKIVCEFKCATEDKEELSMSAPCVPYYQTNDGYWSIYPYFLIYYCAELIGGIYRNYWYKITPINYSAIEYLDNWKTTIMNEVEFQQFLTKLSPCPPKIGATLDTYKPQLNKYFYYNINKEGRSYVVNSDGKDLYDNFNQIINIVKLFVGDNQQKIKDADTVIMRQIDDIIFQSIRECWKKIKKRVVELYFKD